MRNQSWLWPGVREAFFKDLTRLYDRCGPWDVIFFTGDLTQKGSAKEFKELDTTLADLEEHLSDLGSEPVLIPVPGNHDLCRPKELRAAHRILAKWQTHKDAHDEFWDNPKSECREALTEVFGPYLRWWKTRRARLPQDWDLHEGLLPGDFSLTIPFGGRKIGVLGLNSTFVQLTKGNFEGRLHLDVRQFHGACRHEYDGPKWAKKHDLCFLLTHHPPAWLSESAREELRTEIHIPGRFVAHLHGHLHTTALLGASEGAGIRQFWQAPSMFGLEFFGDKVRRDHGYTAGRIELGEREASVRLWPRRANKLDAGPWSLGQYQGIELEDDQGTAPDRLKLSPLVSSLTPVSSVRANTRPSLQRPGLPYESAWHVASREERMAIERLRDGEPVPVCGPLHSGKSWFLRRVREQLHHESWPTTVVPIEFDSINQHNLETVLLGIAEQLAEAVGIEEELHWPTSGTLLLRFKRVLTSEIGPRLKKDAVVVLIIDLPDTMWTFSGRNDLFGLLRQLSGQGGTETETGTWRWLRILLAFSLAPALYIGGITQSPWNIEEIQIPEFTRPQIEALAQRHGLEWPSEVLEALIAEVGGHPFMIREALYAASQEDLSVEQILDTKLTFHIDRLEVLLVRDPELCKSLCRAAAGHPIPRDHGLRLQVAGIVRLIEVESRYVLRFSIYERLLKRLCN